MRLSLHIILNLLLCAGTISAEEYLDGLKRKVEIEAPPQSIVSLAPNITEILFALGMGEKIVGVTDYCDYPSEVETKPKIGGFTNTNLEKIVSLNPDLIIGTADGNPRHVVEKLDELGFTVYVTCPRTIGEVVEDIRKIALITRVEEEGERIAADFNKRLKNVEKKSGIFRNIPPKVFIQLGMNPLVSASRGTFAHSLVETAGGKNILADSVIKYPLVNKEKIIIERPDIIVKVFMEKKCAGQEDIWTRLDDGIPAAAHDRIYSLNPDIILRPGPRLIDGLEKLSDIFTEFYNTKTKADAEPDAVIQ